MKTILKYTKPPHRPAVLGVAGALFATLLLIGIVAAAGESLPRFAITSAGGQTSAGNYRLLSAVGQPVAGAVQNGATLCSGFVCGQGVSTTNTISGTPLTSVTINGPSSGPPGSYFFTASISPTNATPPITYLWDNGDTLAFSSRNLTTGTYTLVVTATNLAASAIVTDSQVVTVSGGASASCPNPLTSVNVSGPVSVTVGAAAAYTATITPVDATTPITYIWSPVPSSGQGTPNATYTFPTLGSQPVALTVQNCAASRGGEVTVTVGASGPSTPRYFIPYAPDQKTTTP